jgi:hypothetical protein
VLFNVLPNDAHEVLPVVFINLVGINQPWQQPAQKLSKQHSIFIHEINHRVTTQKLIIWHNKDIFSPFFKIKYDNS